MKRVPPVSHQRFLRPEGHLEITGNKGDKNLHDNKRVHISILKPRIEFLKRLVADCSKDSLLFA